MPKKIITAEEKESLEIQVKDFSSLEALHKSDGGKILVEMLLSEITLAVNQIATKYSKLTMQEFVAYGAEIDTKMALLRSMTKSTKNKDEAITFLKETLLKE